MNPHLAFPTLCPHHFSLPMIKGTTFIPSGRGGVDSVLLTALVKTAHCGHRIHAPFLADLAMRGCAISFVMRASIALLDSFPGFLMVPMFTF
jgi:hypothetical protein